MATFSTYSGSRTGRISATRTSTGREVPGTEESSNYLDEYLTSRIEQQAGAKPDWMIQYEARQKAYAQGSFSNAELASMSETDFGAWFLANYGRQPPPGSNSQWPDRNAFLSQRSDKPSNHPGITIGSNGDVTSDGGEVIKTIPETQADQGEYIADTTDASAPYEQAQNDLLLAIGRRDAPTTPTVPQQYSQATTQQYPQYQNLPPEQQAAPQPLPGYSIRQEGDRTYYDPISPSTGQPIQQPTAASSQSLSGRRRNSPEQVENNRLRAEWAAQNPNAPYQENPYYLGDEINPALTHEYRAEQRQNAYDTNPIYRANDDRMQRVIDNGSILAGDNRYEQRQTAGTRLVIGPDGTAQIVAPNGVTVDQTRPQQSGIVDTSQQEEEPSPQGSGPNGEVLPSDVNDGIVPSPDDPDYDPNAPWIPQAVQPFNQDLMAGTYQTNAGGGMSAEPGTYKYIAPPESAYGPGRAIMEQEIEKNVADQNNATNDQERSWAWQDYYRTMVGGSLGLGKFEGIKMDPLAQLQDQLQAQYDPSFIDRLMGRGRQQQAVGGVPGAAGGPVPGATPGAYNYNDPNTINYPPINSGLTTPPGTQLPIIDTPTPTTTIGGTTRIGNAGRGTADNPILQNTTDGGVFDSRDTPNMQQTVLGGADPRVTAGTSLDAHATQGRATEEGIWLNGRFVPYGGSVSNYTAPTTPTPQSMSAMGLPPEEYDSYLQAWNERMSQLDSQTGNQSQTNPGLLLGTRTGRLEGLQAVGGLTITQDENDDPVYNRSPRQEYDMRTYPTERWWMQPGALAPGNRAGQSNNIVPGLGGNHIGSPQDSPQNSMIPHQYGARDPFQGMLGRRNEAVGMDLRQRSAGMGVEGAYEGLIGEQDRARNVLASKAQALYQPAAYQRGQEYQDISNQLLNAINQSELQSERIFATSGV